MFAGFLGRLATDSPHPVLDSSIRIPYRTIMLLVTLRGWVEMAWLSPVGSHPVFSVIWTSGHAPCTPVFKLLLVETLPPLIFHDL